AALNGPERLAIGMARFEACIDELAPDPRQLIETRAEHVDALAPGDLRVEPVFFRDAPQHDQLLGRHLAPRDARYDRIRAIALDVGEETIVGVLQPGVRVIEDIVVPGGR